MHEDGAERRPAKRTPTAQVLRQRVGGVPNEVVARSRAQSQLRRRIVDALRRGPQTVPQIAEATGLPPDQLLWHLMAMKKYGKVVEGEPRGDYYEYALSQEQERGR